METTKRLSKRELATPCKGRHLHGHDASGRPCSPATRRALLTGLGALAVLPGPRSTAHAHANDTAPIVQPDVPDDDSFMRRAFDLRQAAVDQGDRAYGAVIVKDGVIVGQSGSRVILDQDPTAHAEMAAIRDAARRLDHRNLAGTVMYSSSRPCPMCEAAAYWAGIGGMVHGSSITSAGAPRLCR